MRLLHADGLNRDSGEERHFCGHKLMESLFWHCYQLPAEMCFKHKQRRHSQSLNTPLLSLQAWHLRRHLRTSSARSSARLEPRQDLGFLHFCPGFHAHSRSLLSSSAAERTRAQFTVLHAGPEGPQKGLCRLSPVVLSHLRTAWRSQPRKCHGVRVQQRGFFSLLCSARHIGPGGREQSSRHSLAVSRSLSSSAQPKAITRCLSLRPRSISPSVLRACAA